MGCANVLTWELYRYGRRTDDDDGRHTLNLNSEFWRTKAEGCGGTEGKKVEVLQSEELISYSYDERFFNRTIQRNVPRRNGEETGYVGT